MDHVQLRLPDALLPRPAAPTPARLEARAEIVRLQASGYGSSAIARSLNLRGVSTPSGRGRWWPETVKRHADPVARAQWAAYVKRYRARERSPLDPRP